MAKQIMLFFLSLILVPIANSQSLRPNINKESMSFEALEKWPSLGEVQINLDGKFSAYTVTSKYTRKRLKINKIDHSWSMEILGAENPHFMGNGHFLEFEKGQDSIGIMNLFDKSLTYTSDTKKPIIPSKSNGKWLAYYKNGKDLILWNAENNDLRNFPETEDFNMSDNGKVLLIVNKTIDNSYTLKWLNTERKTEVEVWHGQGTPLSLCFDNGVEKVAFYVNIQGGGSNIYIAQEGNEPTVINNQTIGMGLGYKIINPTLNFTAADNRLIFNVRSINETQSSKVSNDPVNVDIWHYNDDVLYSQQVSELEKYYINIQGSYSIRDSSVDIVKLLPDESIIQSKNASNSSKFWVLERNFHKANQTQYLSGSGKKSYSLFSILKNIKIPVVTEQFVTRGMLSPTNKYFVYYNRVNSQYVSFNTETGNSLIITKKISSHLYNEETKKQGFKLSNPAGEIMGWLGRDSSVLISDGYDIWIVDLNGKKTPLNLTKGIGRKKHIKLGIINFEQPGVIAVYNDGDNLLLKGINQNNYLESYYRIVIRLGKVSTNFISSPYHYSQERKAGAFFLVKRENAVNFPNWYLTSDFKTFTQLTDLQPQINYKWQKSELIHWKLPNGEKGNGILHLPENFDPHKKYPIIFLYYETAAFTIYQFEQPKLSNSYIRPSWYTSRDYLVFEPDIYYSMGSPGKCAFEAIVSSAKYLAKKPWVDRAHMGLSGASFGGYETNYIVTHTNMFTAAAPAAAIVDWVSDYNSLRGFPFGNNGNQQWVYETHQSRIGFTLWERPDLYIRNSPIFKANRVITPLLILHNKDDGNVQWSQGAEWFNALRRLGKKAWMLQYDGEAHGIFQEKNQRDYTLRQQQFFDHYLKGALPPIWMTKGIPAKLKGIENGLALDSNYVVEGRGPIVDNKPIISKNFKRKK